MIDGAIAIITLADILSSALVPLEATDPDAAIARLVEALNLPGAEADRQAFRQAVLEREKAGSTGIGKGVAIPHARTKKTSRPLLAAGRTSRPIDFKAADAKPVSLIFLLAVPESDPSSHLKALATLSRITSDPKLLKQLQKASSGEELLKLIAPLPF